MSDQHTADQDRATQGPANDDKGLHGDRDQAPEPKKSAAKKSAAKD